MVELSISWSWLMVTGAVAGAKGKQFGRSLRVAAVTCDASSSWG